MILICEIIMLTITLSIFSRPLQAQTNQVSEKSDISELQRKPFHGLPKKMVLCCSGLTDEENVWNKYIYIYIHTLLLYQASPR